MFYKDYELIVNLSSTSHAVFSIDGNANIKISGTVTQGSTYNFSLNVSYPSTINFNTTNAFIVSANITVNIT